MWCQACACLCTNRGNAQSSVAPIRWRGDGRTRCSKSNPVHTCLNKVELVDLLRQLEPDGLEDLEEVDYAHELQGAAAGGGKRGQGIEGRPMTRERGVEQDREREKWVLDM